jgi:hypothetical protein
MSTVLLSALALITADAPAATAAVPPPKPESEIVVTGTPLRETEHALAECIARHCPADQDIEASLAHAENLFVAGRYKDARSVTRGALGRDGRFARQFPVQVADLYRANSRISIHLGEGTDFVYSTLAMKRALKAGLPESDYRMIGADLEIANMYASMFKIDDARRTFEKVEKEAVAIGRPDLAGIARVREAWMDEITGDRGAAREALGRIAADRAPTNAIARFSALILLARLDRQEHKVDSSDALIAELKSAAFPRPVLLFAPPLDLPGPRIGQANAGMFESGSVTRLMATDNFEDRWVDIGFWVTPAGKVDDAEIIRSHGNIDWTKALMRSVGGRIYSPVSGAGSYRVERYTYTALWTDFSGTRMRQRGPDPRVEYLDLTAEPVASN